MSRKAEALILLMLASTASALVVVNDGGTSSSPGGTFGESMCDPNEYVYWLNSTAILCSTPVVGGVAAAFPWIYMDSGFVTYNESYLEGYLSTVLLNISGLQSSMADAATNSSALWANASEQEIRIMAIEGWDVSNASLWANASDQDARLIAIEGWDLGNGTLWVNASDQDGRIIALELASSTHNDGITLLWANASDQDARLIAIEGWDLANGTLWANVSDLEGRLIFMEANASDQDGRIITLETASSTHSDGITLLWANASDQDGRTIALELASSTHNDGITLLWANASDQDGRIIWLENSTRQPWPIVYPWLLNDSDQYAYNETALNTTIDAYLVSVVPYNNATANLDMTAPAMNLSASQITSTVFRVGSSCWRAYNATWTVMEASCGV